MIEGLGDAEIDEVEVKTADSGVGDDQVTKSM
jgi:hypothetical protein